MTTFPRDLVRAVKDAAEEFSVAHNARRGAQRQEERAKVSLSQAMTALLHATVWPDARFEDGRIYPWPDLPVASVEVFRLVVRGSSVPSRSNRIYYGDLVLRLEGYGYAGQDLRVSDTHIKIDLRRTDDPVVLSYAESVKEPFRDGTRARLEWRLLRGLERIRAAVLPVVPAPSTSPKE